MHMIVTWILVTTHFPWNTYKDNFGVVVGENLSCYGILPLWAVNGLSIVCWVHLSYL